MKTKQKTWKDVTLEKALKLEDIKSEGLDAAIEAQAILHGKTVEEVEAWTPKELMEAIKEWNFIKELPKAKLTKMAKIGSRRYVMMELDALTLAQMVDIEEYYSAGLRENAHRIISAMMLPAKRKISWKWPFATWEAGEYSPSAERESDMLQLDMELVWGNLLFFSTIANQYTKGLQAYLAATLEAMKKSQSSQQEGDERQ